MAVVLNRFSTLPVQDAATGDRLQPGRIYLAPPITTWSSHRMGVWRSHGGPRALGASAADILFASVAPCSHPRDCGVLTGADSDGAKAFGVKQWGGGHRGDEASSEVFVPCPGATGAVDDVLSLARSPA